MEDYDHETFVSLMAAEAWAAERAYLEQVARDADTPAAREAIAYASGEAR